MAINKKYSFKDFLDQKFIQVSATEFNNSEIIGSCFYQQVAPDTQVFPTGITGVRFVRCNLDNVLIPTGNIIESDCCHRKIKVQNDLEDWVVDNSLKSVEPVNKKVFEELGLSTDAKDIPVDFIRKEIVVKAEWLRTKDSPEVTDWFLETPRIISQETKEGTKAILKTKWNSVSDKTIWAKNFDTTPTVTQGKRPVNTRRWIDKNNYVWETTLEDFMILKDNITTYTIEGKGVILIEGRKHRPFTNLSVTFAKEQELRQADIDAVKALGGGIAERLGV